MNPLTIEICGMPNSGKSTVVSSLKESWGGGGDECEVIVEGVRNCTFRPKGSLAYGLWGILSQAQTLLELQRQQPQLILLDRGPHDVRAFAGAFQHQELLSQQETLTLKQVAQPLTSLVTQYILFMTPPTLSLSRDDTHAEDQQGTVMNPPFLQSLHEEYNRSLRDSALCVVDSETLSIEESVALVKSAIEKVQAGIIGT